MKQVTMEEISAGGVVYRKRGVEHYFLIGKHSGYHKWVLPKGLVEEGEELIQTAEREVFEEVGVKVRTVDLRPLKTIEYTYTADMDEVYNQNPHTKDTTRRVSKYQEAGGDKVRVHKTVTYYLMELVSEVPSHGWEMEGRKWVSYEQGLQMLAFESERGVLSSAGLMLGCAPAET